jgi:hypothetical protein
MDISGIKEKKLIVTIANTGAGHSIPTGVGDLRQVWLEITVQGKAGQADFQTGVPDKRGELPSDTILFRTVFGDGQGNPVINIAKARQVLQDTRIKAGQQVTRTVLLSAVPEKDSLVRVRLLYRSMPRKILNLIPGKPFEPLPIIEMATVQTQI